MDDAEPLVRAMPRRPLYALHGFSAKISLDILSAVAEEGWCATREAIAADVDSKEVRVAAVVGRRGPSGPELLVLADGTFLRQADIPPEVANLGDCKRLALATAQGLCPGVRAVEMAGYYNDDSHAEWRWVFLIVYRGTLPPDAALPDGAAWRGRAELQALPLEPGLAALAAGLS